MNWSKLPKEKRQHLVLIVALTLVVLGGLGFGLIRRQYQNLEKLAQEYTNATRKLNQMQDAIKQVQRIEAQMAQAKKALAAQETDVASGDLYAWVINTLRRFKADHRVDIPQFSPISGPAEMNLLPNFPYKQASLAVAGTAHFHDLGRFLSDFENEFPHMRIVNLSLDPNPAPASGDPETLSFRMEIINLVKTSSS